MQISGTPPGSSVRVQYRRGGAPPAEVTIRPRITNENGMSRAVIGVLTDEQRPVKVDLQMVSINGQNVGGPSAGLMFALGIYDVLTPGPLTQGRVIAGTGTIDPDGGVGPIGGIQQKLVGARRAGAGVFLTPVTNCAEARQAIPSGLRLIKVSTLDDSIKALESLGQGRVDQPGC
jgi:PDZ domain-containing protein